MVPPHVDVVKLKGETWNKVSLQPHEIGQSHKNVMAHLIRENRELSASLEAKAVDLYLHMCHNLSRCWQEAITETLDTSTVSWLLFFHQ